MVSDEVPGARTIGNVEEAERQHHNNLSVQGSKVRVYSSGIRVRVSGLGFRVSG